MIRRPLAPFVLALALAACSSDDGDSSTDTRPQAETTPDTTAETTPETAEDTTPEAGPEVVEGYDVVLEPSDNDHEALQTALIEAQSGAVIGLMPGTYTFTREVNLSSAANVTVKGMGESREDVILDFAGQIAGDDAITVTAPGFTIENLWVRNSPGDGVVAQAEDSVFRNIKVSWDAGSVTENGAYAVYPTDCLRTLIEDTEISGASDAGIYVGSCEYAIVRNNKVYANVAGIEIENTLHADVYGNEVYDNTVGIAALLLPNLKIKENGFVLIRDNNVYDNNRENFAVAGSVIAAVPVGLGVLVLGGHDIEIRDNTIQDNGATGVLVVSYPIFEILSGTENTDEEMDEYVHRVYVHDNTYDGNGTNPQGALLAIGQNPLENVLWDGIVDAEGEPADLCLGDSPASFRNFNGGMAFQNQSTDTTPHECTHDALPEMETFE